MSTPTSPAISACRAALEGDELLIANSRFERRWMIRDGSLLPLSLLDLESGLEWITASPAGDGNSPTPGPRENSLRSWIVQDHPLQADSLRAEFLTRGDNSTRHYQFQIFPEAGGVLMWPQDEDDDADRGHRYPSREPAASGVETDARHEVGRGASTLSDALEHLPLAPRHLRLVHPTLRDQTDGHAELVLTHEYSLHPSERDLKLKGNTFAVEDTLSGCGLAFLKFAPLPHARPVPDEFDCYYNDGVLAFCGRSSYLWALLCYQNGQAGRIAELQHLQRCLRKYEPGRDALFLSNTWGDRSRDARINEEFISGEIEAGARLGADVIQIDDGWQSGTTANSSAAASGEVDGAWTGFWESNPNFWAPSKKRFPRGLMPLIKRAHECDMRFGLWFAPDSSHDFQNWQRDADQLLMLHRQLGIEYFKLDAIKQESIQGEKNLRSFFDKVLHDSSGRIDLDLDVTAEVRPGYFGVPDCGPIFVENRYTDWRLYWPHATLRAAWQLAHWVDPLRLRVEFLNNARNKKRYGDDPLAPACYAPEYLFATTMFFNPLGWFETQNLPAEYFTRVASLVGVWKRHREQIFGGSIIPVGEVPSGTSWSGFVSVSQERSGGYALLFRELNQQEESSFAVPLVRAGGKIEVLAGDGTAQWRDQKLHAVIPHPQNFLFLKLGS